MRKTTRERQRGYSNLVAMIVVLLLASACGADDAGSEATVLTTTVEAGADTTTAASPSTGAADQAATTAPPAGEETAEVKRVSVTLDGETYEADLSSQGAICVTMSGALAGAGTVTGVDKSSLSFDLPPEDYETDTIDWDAPSIRLDLGEDAEGRPIDWRAGGEIVADYPELAGKSQVDSFTNDGTKASGTATFIDFFQVQLFNSGQVEEPQPVQGTFEVECN